MKNKYKIGDVVQCRIETRPSGIKYIYYFDRESKFPLEEKEVQIIGTQPLYSGATDNHYIILVPDDVTGFMISYFHINNWGIAKTFLNKKFWEIEEKFLLKKIK